MDGWRETKDEWDWFFNNSLDILQIHDTDGQVNRVTPAINRVHGYTPFEFMRTPIAAIAHPDDLACAMAHLSDIANGKNAVYFEGRLLHKDGTYCWIAWTTPTPQQLGNAVSKKTFVVARDITESKLGQQELLRRTRNETLTGLANRATLELAVEQAIASSERLAGARVSLKRLGLDGVKSINDTFGHLAGDEVLRVVGSRLLEAGRKSDLVARLGGDEFSCLLEGGRYIGKRAR